MIRNLFVAAVLSGVVFVSGAPALAGQAPAAASAPDIPISHHDRFYTADQFSNTVSVIDPANNKLLGVIRLGELVPANFSPLYKGQLLVHGMGFSPDHRTLDVVSIGSNSVTFIDTATNAVKHVTYVGRSPHEAFFTPDGKEVWVTVRGENYVSVLDGATYEEKTRITTNNGPGMTIFSPDGKYGYVCSSFTPETVVIAVADHTIVGRVPQASPFCPNIAATPDGTQVWFTLKDTGKTEVFNAQPPFNVLQDDRHRSDHQPCQHRAQCAWPIRLCHDRRPQRGQSVPHQRFLARSRRYRSASCRMASGHRVTARASMSGWRSTTRPTAIDTLTNKVIANAPIGQAPQGVAYVPDAVPASTGPEMGNAAMSVAGGSMPAGTGTEGLQQLGVAGEAAHYLLTMAPPGNEAAAARPPTSVSLYDQGLVQVLEASVTGLEPKQPYVLAFSERADGGGKIEPLEGFMTNPAGSAIVNAIGPIRQIVQGAENTPRRYLVIVSGSATEPGKPVQIQVL